MNLPNKLTFGRIILIPVLVAFLYAGESTPWCCFAALAVFIVASLTDWADGYIARKYHLVTNLGKIMDPLADKLLVSAPMLYLTEAGVFPAWCALLIIAREYLITGMRVVAASGGKVIAASMWGKVKTTVQLVVLAVAIVFPSVTVGTVDIMQIMYYVLTLITVISGISYLAQNKDVFSE